LLYSTVVNMHVSLQCSEASDSGDEQYSKDSLYIVNVDRDNGNGVAHWTRITVSTQGVGDLKSAYVSRGGFTGTATMVMVIALLVCHIH